MLQGEHAAILQAYRDTLLKEETMYVDLRGIPLPRDRAGMPIDPHIPLESVYIQLAAIEQGQKRKQEEQEEQALSTMAILPRIEIFLL